MAHPVFESKLPFLPSVGLLVLRLGIGGMMLSSHGWAKIQSFSEYSSTFPDPIGVGSTVSLLLAIFAEFICAAAVVLGLGTRLMAIPLLFTMLVAALVIHGADPFAKKEFALLYAVPLITLILTGPGRLSLDHLLFKKG